MVLLWKRFCALCGASPPGPLGDDHFQFPDLRFKEELFDVARAFKVQAKRKCPSCPECESILQSILDFSKKCQKTQEFISICGQQKLHRDEEVLQLRDEYFGGKYTMIAYEEENPTEDVEETELDVMPIGTEEVADVDPSSDVKAEQVVEELEAPAVEDVQLEVIQEVDESKHHEAEDPEYLPEEAEHYEDINAAADGDGDEDDEDDDEEFLVSLPSRSKRRYKQPKNVKIRSRRAPVANRTFKYNFKCSHCDLILHSEHHLALHEKKHRPKSPVRLPHICEACGKAFSSPSLLRAHAVIHSDERPFPCDKCPMAFKNAYGLKCHLETHDDNKYICPTCGLALGTSHTYHAHLRIHSDKRPYKCPICPKAFKRHTPLKEHLFAHADLRPYRCPFCGKTFVNGSSCRLHKVRLHPKEQAALEASGKNEEVLEQNRNLPTLEEIKAMIIAKFGKNNSEKGGGDVPEEGEKETV